MSSTVRNLTEGKPKLRSILVHCILPMLAGCGLYVLFRPANLKIHDWFQTVGIEFPEYYHRFHFRLPDYYIYNLPDGLWAYSLVSIILIIHFRENDLLLKAFLALSIIVAIGSELAQLTPRVHGTFDPIDLIFIGLGISLAIINHRNIKSKIIQS